MKYKNYYEILGVTRKSSKDDIKNNYRKLAKKYHPDMNKDNPNAATMFKDVAEAYDTLMDEEKRKKYDKQVSRLGFGFSPNETPLSNIHYEFKTGGNVIGDLLNTILGFNKSGTQDDGIFSKSGNNPNSSKENRKAEKGKDISSNITITMKEGLLGTEKKIAVKGYKGGIKTFTVRIPIGIKDGDKVRLAALGFPGRNGGKNGDLIITVKIAEDRDFKLIGSNLVREVYLTPAAAVMGIKYKTTLFDDILVISLPKHLKNGEYITSEANGYVNEEGVRGDLLLHINIQFPEHISEREEKLYEQLYKLEQRKT